MADVFISHSSVDKEIADRLCSFLEHNGLKCWIAPRDIEPGCEWPVAIREATRHVKVMVVIYSVNSARSTQVPKELTLADKRKKKIIPYKIDDTDLIGSFDYFLSGAHWIMENKANPNASFHELYRVICNSIGITLQSKPMMNPNPAKPVMQQPVQQVGNRQIQPNQTVVSRPNVNAGVNAPNVRQQTVSPVGQMPANVRKKKMKWLIPVCIGGGILVLGAVVFMFFGGLIIGAGVGSSGSEQQQVAEEETISSKKVTPAEDFQYLVNPGGIVITKYIGDDAEVVVPSEIAGSSVVEISYNAFYQNKTIRTVYLPNSVLYIYSGAFAESSVEKVYLPNKLKRIESSVFYKCLNLKKITLPNSLYSIDSWAFAESGLENIVIPDSVEIIMDCAFYKCANLKNVSFSNNLKSIGLAAFSKTVLTEAVLPDSITFLGPEVFMECVELQKIKFPSGITYIPSYFLFSCVNLKQVELPEQLTKIEHYAFAKTPISKFDFSKVPLRSIDVASFGECMNLSEVLLPNTLIKIDNNAFQSCVSLEEITLPDQLQFMSPTAFVASESVNVTFRGKKYAYNELENLSTKMNDLLADDFTFTVMEDGVRIDSYNGDKLCVVIPDSINGEPVTTIGSGAFENDLNLYYIALPSTLTTIKEQAFYNCHALILVAGGQGVEQIGNRAFARSGLLQPFLPQGLTELSEQIFYACKKITDIYVPNGVVSVESEAFALCESLVNVSFANTIQEIAKDAFAESVNVDIYIPYWTYTYEEIESIPILVENT